MHHGCGGVAGEGRVLGWQPFGSCAVPQLIYMYVAISLKLKVLLEYMYTHMHTHT